MKLNNTEEEKKSPLFFYLGHLFRQESWVTGCARLVLRRIVLSPGRGWGRKSEDRLREKGEENGEAEHWGRRHWFSLEIRVGRVKESCVVGLHWNLPHSLKSCVVDVLVEINLGTKGRLRVEIEMEVGGGWIPRCFEKKQRSWLGLLSISAIESIINKLLKRESTRLRCFSWWIIENIF